MTLEKCLYGCVCVRIPLYLRIYKVDFNQIVLIFFVFSFCIGEENNFSIHRFVFVLFRIFDFGKICFRIFLMIRFKFLNRIGSVRKSIKNLYFQKKKKKIASDHGSFVINKNVFFVSKLITHKLNGQFYSRKITIMHNINSSNL